MGLIRDIRDTVDSCLSTETVESATGALEGIDDLEGQRSVSIIERQRGSLHRER